MAVAIPLLVWYASKAILASTDGDLQQAITDPSAPGYETLVVSTPSHMIFGVDGDDHLVMVAVVGLSSNDHGGVLLVVPPETLVDGTSRLADVYEAEGSAGARRAVAGLLAADVDAITVLDPTAWTQFTAATAPLSMNLTDDLVRQLADGTTEVAYKAGVAEIPASHVADVIAWLHPGEDPFNRMTRQRQFWLGWIEAIAAAGRGPDVVPGEVDSGLGRMVRGLADGVYRVVEAPVSSLSTTADGKPAFLPFEQQLREIAVEMLPFPLPAEPGARARVRLLDGVGGLDVASRFSPALVRAGAQIVVIGNAGQFGVAETEIVYHDPAFEAIAQAFRDALGAGRLTYEPLADAVLDVTVLIGADQGLVTG